MKKYPWDFSQTDKEKYFEWYNNVNYWEAASHAKPSLLKFLRYFRKGALHRIIVYTAFLGKTFCDADELPAAVLLFRLHVARRH